jgi:trehalose 6-phosphate synthase
VSGDTRYDLLVLANRLPVQQGDGDSWETSPGGLVRAMLAVLRGRQGCWIGWPGDTDASTEPFDHDGVHLQPISLSAEELTNYYEGASNAMLWPLYHDALRPSVFDNDQWATYESVNDRFAARAAELAAPGAIVWVHDYHLQLVPALLRARRPDLRIGFFLHIPFPPQELFLRLPWREEILRGVLGADVVGLQRVVAAENVAAVARRLLGATGAPPEIHLDDRVVHVSAHPISIDDGEIDEIARRPETTQRAALLRARLGHPDKVVLGVDRLDYTKGIDARLQAFRRYLTEEVEDRRSVVMVQVAVPSRGGVEGYDDERRRVEQLVGAINGEFSSLGYPVVHYLHQSFELEELVSLYRATDVMLVTPLRDGMNLVAKEFAAARVDDSGVLVLSEFAGAADELTEAVSVNPHDIDQLTRSISAALSMPDDEASTRMQAIRKTIAHHDVFAWADGFLELLGGDQAARAS